MKVSIRKSRNHANPRWVVSYCPPGGKRKRSFFTSKVMAEAERDEILRQRTNAGDVWLSLTVAERGDLISIYSEAQKRGVNLRVAMDFYLTQGAQITTCRLGEAVEKYLAEREAARLAHRTVRALKWMLRKFALGKEGVELSVITREDVLLWLKTGNIGAWAYNTRLVTLKSFFTWCVETGKLIRSPAMNVKIIGLKQMPNLDKAPAILSVDQCRAMLKSAMENDRALLPYIAVCLFAGLRPEREAANLTWQDIREGVVFVRGLHAKNRQQRDVPTTFALVSWLSCKGDLPVVNLRKRFDAVRKTADLLKGWPQDVMRHTFASNHLATFGAEKTIVALGHGDYTMLFRHYRQIVSPEQSAAFWNLLP